MNTHHYRILINFLYASAAVAWLHALATVIIAFFRRMDLEWRGVLLMVAVGLLLIVVAAGIHALPRRRQLSAEGKVITGTVITLIVGLACVFWIEVLSR